MQTLAIGDMQLKRKSTNRGFTLLEVLVVTVIIGIVSVVGVNLINNRSPQREAVNQAKKISGQINFLCEKAVFENRVLGLEFSQQAYQQLSFEQGTWLSSGTDLATPLSKHLNLIVLLDDSQQIIDKEFQDKPQIVCFPNGQSTPFELRLSSKEASTEAAAVYLLKSMPDGKLIGAWQ